MRVKCNQMDCQTGGEGQQMSCLTSLHQPLLNTLKITVQRVDMTDDLEK